MRSAAEAITPAERHTATAAAVRSHCDVDVSLVPASDSCSSPHSVVTQPLQTFNEASSESVWNLLDFLQCHYVDPDASGINFNQFGTASSK